MLDGITAFVTGASQGIGRVIATELADEGANVVLAARGDGIYETEGMIDDDDRTLTVETDVTDEGSVESAIEATVERFGGLDCLVNNAGIAGPTKPVEEVTVEEWQKTMDVNVLGPFLCAKHASPQLRASKGALSISARSAASGPSRTGRRTPPRRWA